MRNGQNDQKTVKCVKEFFFIKLTKACKENQEWHILYIRSMTPLTSRHNSIIQNFTTSWIHEKWSKWPKNCELRKKFSFHKIKEDIQRKPVVKCFIHSRVDVTYAGFRTSELQNFMRTDQNTTKLSLFNALFIKSLKLWHKNRCEFLASAPI